MTYDSGIAPLQVSFSLGSQLDYWKRMFQKMIKTEFDKSELKTLSLESLIQETDSLLIKATSVIGLRRGPANQNENGSLRC